MMAVNRVHALIVLGGEEPEPPSSPTTTSSRRAATSTSSAPPTSPAPSRSGKQPDGLDTQVGEAGTQVSGGQRQRIAITRLLISDARFLIFDEPTTHLDPDTGGRVLDAIAATARLDGRSVLVITHERAGLARFDETLELQEGRLVAASH